MASLRWYYPVQVLRSAANGRPLSPGFPSSRVDGPARSVRPKPWPIKRVGAGRKQRAAQRATRAAKSSSRARLNTTLSLRGPSDGSIGRATKSSSMNRSGER